MEPFKGFLIEARNPAMPPPSSPNLIGRFTSLSDGTQVLNCDPAGVATDVSVSVCVWEAVPVSALSMLMYI